MQAQFYNYEFAYNFKVKLNKLIQIKINLS